LNQRQIGLRFYPGHHLFLCLGSGAPSRAGLVSNTLGLTAVLALGGNLVLSQ
jgi:hypothetical protein